MAHPDYIRERAIQMRVKRDLTIDDIAERLALPRTTVFYRVKDIPLLQKNTRPRKLGADSSRRGDKGQAPEAA